MVALLFVILGCMPSSAPSVDLIDRLIEQHVVEGSEIAGRQLVEHFAIARPHLERFLAKNEAHRERHHRKGKVYTVLCVGYSAWEEHPVESICFLLRAHEIMAGPAVDPSSVGAVYGREHSRRKPDHCKAIDNRLRYLPPGQDRLIELATREVAGPDRARARRALLRMSPGLVRDDVDLIALLDRADGLLVDWIASAFAARGREKDLRTIRERVGDGETGMRINAIRVAARFTADEKLARDLAVCLRDPDPDIRWWATWALGGFAPLSIPWLVDTLNDEDASVRARAAEGIEKSIASAGGDVASRRALLDDGLPALESALSDSSNEVRLFAAMTIWKLGWDARSLAPALETHVEDTDVGVRRFVRGALARMDELGERRLRDLQLALKDAGLVDVERTDTSEFRDEIGADEGEIVTAARRYLLDRPAGSARWWATVAVIHFELDRVLAEARTGDDEALALVRALHAELDWRLRSQVGEKASSFLQYPVRRRTVVPGVLRLGAAVAPDAERLLLEPERADLDVAILPTLFDRLGARMLPALGEALELGYEERAFARRALQTMGGEAQSITPLIVSAWRWQADEIVKRGVDNGWGEIMRRRGTPGVPEFQHDEATRVTERFGLDAIAVLERALDDRSALVRLRAVKALGGMRQRRAEARPRLVPMLDDPEDAVRGMAALILGPEESGKLHWRARAVLRELGLD